VKGKSTREEEKGDEEQEKKEIRGERRIERGGITSSMS